MKAKVELSKTGEIFRKVYRMKIFLTSKEISPEQKANPYFFSIEAGEADGLRHFDHHKAEHRGNPCPCNDGRIMRIESIIPPAWINKVEVQITHFCTDTAVGLSRLLGMRHHDLFITEVLEVIDKNGSLPLENLDIPEYWYFLGMHDAGKSFPKASDSIVDVTELVYSILSLPIMRIIDKGKEIAKELKSSLVLCKMEEKHRVGLWKLPPDKILDPSMAYREDIDVVVLYREDRKSISLYSSPHLGIEVCKDWAGIVFSGHPRACGSPRDENFSYDDAVRVFQGISSSLDTDWE